VSILVEENEEATASTHGRAMRPQRRFLEDRFTAKAPRSQREVDEKSYLLEVIGAGEFEPRMNANGRE
jgi:hypothetical protein